MKSLRARLFVAWALALASACAVGFLLVQLYRHSAAAQIARAEAAAANACERIGDGYAYYTTGWTPHLPVAEDAAFRADLTAMLALSLAGSPATEGGVWQTEDGHDPVALAFAAAGRPGAVEAPAGDEAARIAALNAAVAESGLPEADRIGTGAQTLLLQACPLRGPLPGVTGWAMVRVASIAGSADVQVGVAVLLALVLALAGGLGWLVLSWGRHVGRIEAALAAAVGGELPPLPLTGEAELDRIVAALNTAGHRLAEAHRRSEALSARVAASERLAALGRVAAGVAHEIRNPIAAMRLRAENALAGDDARRHTALEAILAQIQRLDRLIDELLAMTQRREPQPEPVDVAALLHDAAADHRRDGVTLRVEAPPDPPARLDPALLRRTLDALLDNAVRHTPAGGTVTLRAERASDTLRITVADTGPGIAPELARHLFEPFVTGRADGTGLGLAIARELADAQGARLTLAHPGGDGSGAAFLLEVPCRAS
jgi:signal transduction histidine kinase